MCTKWRIKVIFPKYFNDQIAFDIIDYELLTNADISLINKRKE